MVNIRLVVVLYGAHVLQMVQGLQVFCLLVDEHVNKAKNQHFSLDF
jgi:hypothetical protein